MMTACACCGLTMTDGSELCVHHHSADSDDWAATNRIMCDFVHRKLVPARLTNRGRDDDFWGERQHDAERVIETVSAS